MRIVEYKVNAGEGLLPDDLQFSSITFKQLNLIVGDSGTGKTRLLNTIFNVASMVRQKKIYIGKWDMIIEHLNHTYRWNLQTSKDDNDRAFILLESVSILASDGKEQTIINRTPDRFLYEDKVVPKLSTTESSISLFQNDDIIKPLYEGLGLILRRSFSGPDLEISASLEPIPQPLLKKIEKYRRMNDVFWAELSLSSRLYILQKHFSDVYKNIKRLFINTFPFIIELDVKSADTFGIQSAGIVPIVALKEKHVSKWIPISQFSSGMRKVLLILTDIFTMPREGGIYLIDEYENSLGINAINFFPSILSETDTPIQYIITSHHPYIIGNIPVKNWIILYRKGNEILVKQGDELEKRFGKSKQQAFIQLINDPFYVQGIQQ
jgi:AAA15 family ATPase/GTPase